MSGIYLRLKLKQTSVTNHQIEVLFVVSSDNVIVQPHHLLQLLYWRRRKSMEKPRIRLVVTSKPLSRYSPKLVYNIISNTSAGIQHCIALALKAPVPEIHNFAIRYIRRQIFVSCFTVYVTCSSSHLEWILKQINVKTRRSYEGRAPCETRWLNVVSILLFFRKHLLWSGMYIP